MMPTLKANTRSATSRFLTSVRQSLRQSFTHGVDGMPNPFAVASYHSGQRTAFSQVPVATHPLPANRHLRPSPSKDRFIGPLHNPRRARQELKKWGMRQAMASSPESSRADVGTVLRYLQNRPQLPLLKANTDYRDGLTALRRAHQLDASANSLDRASALLEAERRFSQAAHHTPFEPVRMECYQAAGLCSKLSKRPQREQAQYQQLAKRAFEKSPFQLEELKREASPPKGLWAKLLELFQGPDPMRQLIYSDRNEAEQLQEALHALKATETRQSIPDQLQALKELHHQSNFRLVQHLLSGKPFNSPY